MTVIRTIADIALEEPRSLDECVTALTGVNSEGERLGKLINHLLELARADDAEAHRSLLKQSFVSSLFHLPGNVYLW